MQNNNIKYPFRLETRSRRAISKIKNIRGRGFSSLWIIIIVALIGLAALVAFGVLDLAGVGQKPPVGEVAQDTQIKQLESLSNSDEVNVIENEIGSTDLDNVDLEMTEVDSALNQL